jgi:hypothetical protein
MGFFSWVCKGCGKELRNGEYVRIAGFVGVYDGYGRVDGLKGGSFDSEGSDFPSWHEKCYQKSPLKGDETLSRSAPNQGIGNPRIEFIPPGVSVEHYIVVAYRWETHPDYNSKPLEKFWRYNLPDSGEMAFDVNDSDLNDREKVLPHRFAKPEEAIGAAMSVTGFEEVYVLAQTKCCAYQAWTNVEKQ